MSVAVSDRMFMSCTWAIHFNMCILFVIYSNSEIIVKCKRRLN